MYLGPDKALQCPMYKILLGSFTSSVSVCVCIYFYFFFMLEENVAFLADNLSSAQ